MKLIHLSDLHLGKRVNEFPMLEDQAFILKKIINIIDDQQPDGIIIAGDVYDKSVPSSEAITLFDDFLVSLAQRNLQVFVISGNHDSPERLSFGNRLMDASGIHIAPVYTGAVEPITLEDQYGKVNIYMLPFIKPVHVRQHFPEETIESYTDAVRVAVSNMDLSFRKTETAGAQPGDPSGGQPGGPATTRNVLVTHQFVTGAERSESEEISVGGSDNVDASVFSEFDYVALGHIPGPQNMAGEMPPASALEDGAAATISAGANEATGAASDRAVLQTTIRYCGTPLKYSFSEASHTKSVTVVELAEKGNISVTTVPLEPLRDMAEIKGKYEELTLKSFYENTSYPGSYLRITLTDEDDVPDAVSKLRIIYPYLMRLDYDNMRTRHKAEITGAGDVETKSPLELFAEFYKLQNNTDMSAEQEEFMSAMIEKVWEG